MTTEWLIAFVGAPAALVIGALLLVFFTRPDPDRSKVNGTLKKPAASHK